MYFYMLNDTNTPNTSSFDINYNVMKSCDYSRDWSNQIKIISDHYSRSWLSHQSPDLPNQPSNFRMNLLDQSFKSTFWINFLNQPFESTYAISLLIKPAAPQACGTSHPLTNITYSSRGEAYHPWPSLGAVWMKALLDAARTSLLYKR